MIKKILSFGLPVFITLALFEACLWLVPLVNTHVTNKVTTYLNYDWPYTSQGWAYRYLNGIELTQSSLYQAHPKRGWVFKPNQDVWIDGYQWTTNRFGHRSLHTPNPHATATKIYITGDSQTAGDEVDDIHVWPTQLSQRMPELEVINAAVSGYSLSQMIISAIEDYPVWQPDIIVLAVIEDDLYRSALDFRTGPMPTVTLEPFGVHPAAETDMNTVKQQYFTGLGLWLNHFKTYRLFHSVKDRYIEFPKNIQKAHLINQALLKQLVQSVGDTQIIFAYLPYPYELAGQAKHSMQTQYDALCSQFQNQIECVHAGPYMLEELAGYRQGGGHYHRKGNLTAAIAIESAVKKWQQTDSKS